MKNLTAIAYTIDSASVQRMLNVTVDFKPPIAIFEINYLETPQQGWEDAKYKDTITIYEDDPVTKRRYPKATIPIKSSNALLLETINRVNNGEFDKNKTGETRIYNGGDPNAESSWVNLPWSDPDGGGLGFLPFGLGNILNPLFNLVPWWAIGAVAVYSTYRTSESRGNVSKIMWGSAAAVTGLYTINKLRKK
ncbi:MAG: hypothetical protein M3Q56_11405 [Bacteroidota bacterium]|nr:hypothetical protein [Bacteroidota bacterium]